MNLETIPFAGPGLDRAQRERRDPDWLRDRLGDERSRFLPIWNLELLVQGEASPRLAFARTALRDHCAPECDPVFLGLSGDVAHFALDLSHLEDPAASLELGDTASFHDLRAVGGRLEASEAALAAHARGLVDWHARNGHCSACGAKTLAEAGGGQRRCPECAAEHFPRTDPVVIAAVTRGERCLLGRSAGWPDAMFSALAGFVEPGEDIEAALRREVFEEAGIRVGRVEYRASQPWPFPCSLMIGCWAEAESDAITIDPLELEAAHWFERAEVRAALGGPTPELILPPPVAIAHHLLREWALNEKA